MNLESLADKLQDDRLGKIGKDIFINHMPASAEQGVLLRQPYIGTPIDYELPNYRNTRFQAAIRSKDFKVGEQLAREVSASLTLTETVLPEMDIRYIRPRTEPVPFPLNAAGMFEFLVIFDAVYVIVE